MMRLIGLISVVVTGSLLLYAVSDFPAWGDPNSRPSTYLSPHYITKSLEETAVPNIVTAVLADYRGFDTMFETAVIFAAGVAVLTILRRKRRRKRDDKAEPHFEGETVDIPEKKPDLIIANACRMLVPVIQLFALYVIAHGHSSPGGGFQGGVILGASMILVSLAHNLKASLRRLSEKTTFILANIGVLIYAGIGFLCVLLGANFLGYSALHKVLPATDEIMARYHGMLGVEIGVGIAVMTIMFIIYMNLSSSGDLEEGI